MSARAVVPAACLVVACVSVIPVDAAVLSVPAGGDLQAALNAAQPGDTILLEPAATFAGNFVLPAKSGTSWITIRSAADDAVLPPSGTRIDPSYAGRLARIQSPNSAPALATAAYAHHYQLQFLEFASNYQGYGDIIQIGDGSTSQNNIAMVPHDFVLDRVYIHGDPTYGQKRGIALNSAATTISNSYISDCKAVGQDSQAIGGWNGPGPFTIANNYLEAAGENILFGGADPAIANLVPSDIAIRGNYISKPVAWKTQAWSVKNLVELKNAQRVTIEGNIIENNWQAAQSGYAVVFTPRNQDGTAPWSVVQQVQFTNNIVRHVASAINILGTDNNHPSQLTNTLTIRNNVFSDVSAANWGGAGRFVLISGGSGITFDHNTVLNDGSTDLYGDGSATAGFVFTNNIIQNNAWAIMGGNASPGNVTIAMYFPGSWFEANVIVAANSSQYPAGNYYPALLSDVAFTAADDLRLSASSPFRGLATDGSDVGCAFDALAAATRLAEPPAKAAGQSTTPAEWFKSLVPASAANVQKGTPLVLWRNDDGRLAAWAMVGTAYSVGIAPSINNVDPLWKIAAFADLDGDGNPDIVWQHRDGWIAVWLMNGLSVIASVPLSQAAVDPRWRLAAVADFDGDGHPDVVWQHEDGWVALWLMNGLTVTASVALGRTTDRKWRIAGATDINGDGTVDLVWQHRDGWVAAWLLDGAGCVQTAIIGTGQAGPGWRLAALADLDGDGRADLIWEHRDGWLASWLLNGPTIKAAVPLTPGSSGGGGWHVVTAR